MAKRSKIRSVSTKPEPMSKPDKDHKEYYCYRCGKKYPRQKGVFPASQSLLFRGNGGYLPICNDCVDGLFEHYRDALGDDEEAVKRMCLKLDIYWNHDVYEMLGKASTSASMIRTYIARTNLIKYVGKTYDDTLDEEYAAKQDNDAPTPNTIDSVSNLDEKLSELAQDDGIEVSPEIVEFWGAGFEPAFYLELDRKYKQWTGGLASELDKGEEAIYKQVCILEATINKDSAAGKPIEKNVNALNSLLGSANLKPSQKKNDDSLTAFGSTPFGVGIRMYENTRPIPQPDPELQDVDGIIKYISIWFLGHLCKMLGIKNTYCKLYEDEIAKLRVDKPELDDEDDESLFDGIFGGDQDGK